MSIPLKLKGSKIEALVHGRDNVARFGIALTEGCKYTLHRVSFTTNWAEVQFRAIDNSYECFFTNRTSVESFELLDGFPRYPKCFAMFEDVYAQYNKTYAGIMYIPA